MFVPLACRAISRERLISIEARKRRCRRIPVALRERRRHRAEKAVTFFDGCDAKLWELGLIGLSRYLPQQVSGWMTEATHVDGRIL